MPLNLVPVQLPLGVFKNGTDYEARGRWSDADKVRWHDAAIRPIGGYERRVVPSTGAQMAVLVADAALERVRDLKSWSSNVGINASVLASNLNLLYMGADNAITNITPATFVGGPISPVATLGYGTGLYGASAYGTPRLTGGVTPIPVGRCSMDAWGEDLIINEVIDGKIYSYGIGDALAVLVPNAPTDALGIVVTDQRILMAIREGRIVQWSDREDRENWTPAVANESGDKFLAGEGSLLSIHEVLDKQLILTETDAHTATYIGPPYIYGFKKVGSNCGPIGNTCAGVTDTAAIWVGTRNFWIYDGAVRKLPCDVMDYFFANKALGMDSKIVTQTVSEFNEIWWLYQSVGGTDVDSYVSFNYVDNYWNVGTLNRTAGGDKGALSTPIMVDEDGYVWSHELVGVAVSGAFAESGPLELGNGAIDVAVRAVLPDTAASGDVSITLKGRSMSTEPDFTYGPYTYNNPTPTRAIGREIRMRVEGVTTNWEVGTMRMDVATTGGGR